MLSRNFNLAGFALGFSSGEIQQIADEQERYPDKRDQHHDQTQKAEKDAQAIENSSGEFHGLLGPFAGDQLLVDEDLGRFKAVESEHPDVSAVIGDADGLS